MRTQFVLSLTTTVLLTLGFSVSHAKTKAPVCTSCETLQSLAQQFTREEKSGTAESRYAVAQKIGREIQRLDRDEAGVGAAHIKAIVSTLLVVKDETLRLEIFEHNASFFRDHESEFDSLLNQQNTPASAQIKRDIASIIAWQKYGQNPPANVLPPSEGKN